MQPDLPFSIKNMGRVDYRECWQAMREFTLQRTPGTPSEIWLVEHDPVFTLGQAGKKEHLLAPGEIPVIETDRGGQVTYHGPGQIIIYTLLDLQQARLGVRSLVNMLENAVVGFLNDVSIKAGSRTDAPGVYVDNMKIASLGLKIRKGCSYHGIALNVDMDLEPFTRINPCGYQGMEVTQLKDLGVIIPPQAAGLEITDKLAELLQTRINNK